MNNLPGACPDISKAEAEGMKSTTVDEAAEVELNAKDSIPDKNGTKAMETGMKALVMEGIHADDHVDQ